MTTPSCSLLVRRRRRRRRFMREIKRIHAHAVRNNLDVVRILLDNLLRNDNLTYARSLLLSVSIPPPSTFLYNRLLQTHNSSHHCFHLYSHMRRNDRLPNPHSFTYLLSSCASLRLPDHGRALHAQFVRFGFQSDTHVLTSLIAMYCKNSLLGCARKVFDGWSERDIACWNSMIGGYAKSGRLNEARELFEAMPFRNVISWTALISGYSQNGRYVEAMDVFMRLWEERDAIGGVRPNEVTLASVLPACANLGALEMGGRIEVYARENRWERNMFVSNALLEMYAKCGSVGNARRIFEEIGYHNRRNMYSWNSMIVGMAVHGRWKEALQLFEEMNVGGFNPDDITFVGILLACTHGGRVSQGWEVFKSMENKYGVNPKLEHYGCMVDLLGRAGLMRKAYQLITDMPMKPDAVIWGTLLGACSFHREVELAEIAADFLFQLEPWNPGNYVILSNVYASVGRWDGVAKLWNMKRGRQFKKTAGFSSFELDGRVHRFVVEDKSHHTSNEIYALLDEIQERMKLVHCDFIQNDIIYIYI